MQSAVLNCQTNTYRRREPEKEVLYQAIADNLETFLKRLRVEGHELPKYVVEEFYRISFYLGTNCWRSSPRSCLHPGLTPLDITACLRPIPSFEHR